MFIVLVQGQETSTNSDSSKYQYQLDIGAGTYYQFSTFGNTTFNSAKISKLLPRRINDPSVRNVWNLDNDLISDNPLFHGSYFFKLGARFKFGKSLTVTGSINAEQRGFSDGVFSRRTRNFYPYFNAKYSNQLGKFSYLFQVGDFRNFKIYEGLTFYNLETQSWIFKLKYGKFFVKHIGVGDLLVGIGLGIDDVYDYSFGFENLVLNQDSTLILNLTSGYSNNRGSFGGGFWNFSNNLNFENKYSFYSQVSRNRQSNIAFLLGIKIKSNFLDKVDFQTSLEYRNYSSGFNLGYVNTVYYRNPTEGAGFTNSSNNVFIPLDYYERNFSQWAVFSEYQNVDIKGISLNSDIRYNMVENIFFHIKLDFNWLISKEETFLYPFYYIGFGSQPISSTEISLALTNKAMNFDKNFPTFYTSEKPYFLLRLYKPLKFIKENDLR